MIKKVLSLTIIVAMIAAICYVSYNTSQTETSVFRSQKAKTQFAMSQVGALRNWKSLVAQDHSFMPVCNFTLHSLDYNQDGSLSEADLQGDFNYLANGTQYLQYADRSAAEVWMYMRLLSKTTEGTSATGGTGVNSILIDGPAGQMLCSNMQKAVKQELTQEIQHLRQQQQTTTTQVDIAKVFIGRIDSFMEYTGEQALQYMLVKYQYSVVARSSVFNSLLWNMFTFFDVKENGQVTAGEVAQRVSKLALLFGAPNRDAREARQQTKQFLKEYLASQQWTEFTRSELMGDSQTIQEYAKQVVMEEAQELGFNL